MIYVILLSRKLYKIGNEIKYIELKFNEISSSFNNEISLNVNSQQSNQ